MPDKLKASSGFIFESGKTYTHAQGLSCCFRQWRASHSHCRFLHGYSLQVTIVFRSQELDDRNWVMDFGGLKEIKEWLTDTFDHKTLIAKDDPMIDYFRSGSLPDENRIFDHKVIDLVEMEHVGCEAFAKLIFNHVWKVVGELTNDRVYVQEVEVREHEGNFARYRRNS